MEMDFMNKKRLIYLILWISIRLIKIWNKVSLWIVNALKDVEYWKEKNILGTPSKILIIYLFL